MNTLDQCATCRSTDLFVQNELEICASCGTTISEYAPHDIGNIVFDNPVSLVFTERLFNIPNDFEPSPNCRCSALFQKNSQN